MVCPYCHHQDTNVTNSRQHKVQSKIWRRRQCERCKTTFTTYEQIADKELPLVSGAGKPTVFSPPRLLLSIYGHLLPTTQNKPDVAQALTDTVYHELSEGTEATLTRKIIAETTYKVLRRYNPRIGLSYGVAHEIITPDALK
jgi:transcriptional repressor NrdR